MSLNQPSSSVDDDTRNPQSARRSPTLELDSVNRRLKRLKDEVLPFYPFLLTVPTDVPFRLGNRFVNDWAVGKDGPFGPEEQQLQYMTFLTHQEGDSLLVAVGDWSDGTGGIMTNQHSGPQSAASTPTGGMTKKKISLSDYKNKTKTGTLSAPVQDDARSIASPHAFEDQQRAHKSKIGENKAQIQSNNAMSSENKNHPAGEISTLKRPSDQTSDPSRAHGRRSSDLHSPKRPRLSSDKTVNKEFDHSKQAANGLPALLSPTLPPASISPRLPRLLSPTLPPDIEEELARLRDECPVRDALHKRTSSAVSNVSRDDNLKVQSADRNKSRLASNASPSTMSSKPIHPPGKPLSAELTSTSSESFEASKSDSGPPTADRQSQPVSRSATPKVNTSPAKPKTSHAGTLLKQLVVRLKYGRSNRRRVEALLKFSGKRKVELASSSAKTLGDEGRQTKKMDLPSKNPATDQFYSSLSRNEKQGKHAASDETYDQLRERSKEPLNNVVSEKPRTPVSQPSNSTKAQQQEKTKQTLNTPGRDYRGSLTRQIGHGDNEVKTPVRQSTKHPSGDLEKITKLSPLQSDNQVSRLRNLERRAWRDEFQKYGNLGRELKHAAERHTAKEHVTAEDEKFAAATAIEAILCFILAFVADDQSKALARQVGDSATWLSILAYWRVVKKNSSSYPQLHSLCLLLGAVSYDAIHALDLERLAISSLPGDHSPVPTPGSDGNTVISDESKRNRKEFLELKTRLPDCYKEAQKLWLEGTRGLSEDILADEFPVTWSKRSNNFSERGKHQLKVGEYSGEYFLPLGRTTTPIEVVRFGWSILNEWCRKEGVAWNGRLGL